MRIALAQINSHLGNFSHNSQKILNFTNEALDRHADVVVFPEASLFGYHPMDLLERATTVDEQLKELKKLTRTLPKGIAVVLGAFTKNSSSKGKPFFNSAIVIYNNKIIFESKKELLPTYDVFDDARHIQPGDLKNNIFKFKNKKILLSICEDIWAWPQPNEKRSNYDENPIKKIKPKTVDYVLNLSASPYYNTKIKMREHVVRQTAKYLKAPMVYVNMVGGQDELIFDGGSFAIDSKGKKLAQALSFNEDLVLVDFNKSEGQIQPQVNNQIELKRQALVLGLRDFCEKINIKKVVLGLSGGIDSAVVACLAVDALGSDQVMAVGLPGPYSAKESLSSAEKLAQQLKIKFFNLPISKVYENAIHNFESVMGQREFDLVNENLQARLRGLNLMAIANRSGAIVINTSNKSEMATGYSTLYGDLIGAISPIGDLLKGEVYELASYYNKENEIIPQFIIDRAPSAELREGQKDQDSLPPYDLLDAAVIAMVEKRRPARTKEEKFVLNALLKSEFKRWQAPPILKVREHSFGRGRRFPVAHGSRE